MAPAEFARLWNAAAGSVAELAAALGRSYASVRAAAAYARRRGHALKPRRRGPGAAPPIDRIRPRLVARPGGCLEWPGVVDKSGRPKVQAAAGASGSVARHVWEAERGPLPPGVKLRQCGRNLRCVAPAHARPVTGGSQKLTPAGRADVARRARAGEDPAALAAEYGVHVDHVRRLRRAGVGGAESPGQFV